MLLPKLLKQKKEYSDNIKIDFKLLKRNKALWFILINDKKVLSELIIWLSYLPANFIILWDNFLKKQYNNISFSNNVDDFSIWFDFLVCNECNKNIINYFKQWIVPIIKNDNYFSSLLTEFNAIKTQWNSFIFNNNNSWDIYYAIIRYLENYKFPYDNKSLVKNVLEI